jgi:hypothetical protein
MTTLTETAGDEGTTASESPVVRFREVGKVCLLIVGVRAEIPSL